MLVTFTFTFIRAENALIHEQDCVGGTVFRRIPPKKMEHYKMNMIVTGQFEVKSDTSRELVEKLTRAWDKKSLRAVRAGGVSTLALALAACGGEDNTPFNQADIDAAVAPLNDQITTLTAAKTVADEALEAALADVSTAEETIAQLTSEASDAADALEEAIAERDTAAASLVTANADLATANTSLTAANTSLSEVRADLGLSSTATAQDMMNAITALEDTASANGDAATAANASLASLRTDLGLTADATTQDMIDAITALEAAASDAATARDAAITSLSNIAVDLGLASGASEAEIIAAIDELQAAIAAANPETVTEYTVTDGQLVGANATAGGVYTLDMIGSPASATITVESDGITYTNLILDTGAANVTVIAGDQNGAGDNITIVGSGTNDVTLGAGNDSLIVYGSGTTVVNAGA